MRTVSIFKNGANQAVRLPKDMEFQGVKELEIIKEGDSVILRPVRPSWQSLFSDDEPADKDFLRERPPVFEEGRFNP